MARTHLGWVAILCGMTAMLVTAMGYPQSGASTANETLTVIDGDTLDLDGRAIDLAGIDAPELGQWCHDGSNLYQCGLTAAFELKKVLALEPVKCVPAATGDGSYECRTSNGSLGEMLVKDGLAVARSGALRLVAERKARQVPLGIWRGAFVDPRDWRDGKRLSNEPHGQTCPVLGLDVDGVLRYSVPTDPNYDVWKANAGAIRRRFCSDEEARASGYSHAVPRSAENPAGEAAVQRERDAVRPPRSRSRG